MFTPVVLRLFCILSCAFILVFIQHIGMTVVALDVMRTLGLSPEGMGVLGSSYLYAYACSQFCSGMLAERFGPRRVLSGMFAVATCGALLFAMTDVFALSMLGRALNGIGMAVVLTSSLTLFGRWFPAREYARMCALFFAVGGFGNYIGTASLAWLNAAIGWRPSFLIIAGLTGAVAAGVWFIVRDWPAGAPDQPDKAEPATRNTSFGELGRDLAHVATNWDFWRLVGWFATLPAMFYAFAGLWAGPYLEAVYGLSKTETGNLLSVGALGFILGNPLLAWVSEHWLKSHRLGIGLSGPVGLVCAYALVFHTADMNLPTLYLLMLVLSMAVNAPNAVAHTMTRILFGTRLNGPLGGIFGFAVFISGGLLQILLGVIIAWGEGRGLSPAAVYSRAFMPFLLTMLIGTVAGLTLTETCAANPKAQNTA